MSIVISETTDLDTCMALRFEVFVGEQNVPVEEERDALDAVATHLLATMDGKPMGTARIVWVENVAKIGRVCVLKAARGTGLGKQLIEAAVAVAAKRDGITKAKLGSQVQAIGFYEKLGFEVFGPVYLDAGIEHRDMVRTLR